jgi:hypothetical protein
MESFRKNLSETTFRANHWVASERFFLKDSVLKDSVLKDSVLKDSILKDSGFAENIF